MNKKISLCLGGGGARWLIHAWVYKFLEEHDYEIQEVSGTSMGAIIASAIALGMSVEEVIQLVKKEINFWKFLDIWFSRGFISWNKIFSSFEKIFGDTKLNEGKIPLKIVATCLDNSEKKVFGDDIRMVDAIRASISVPWVFQPHIIDGHSYVDGMLFENLPVSILSWEHVLAVSTAMTKVFLCKSTKSILTKVFNIAILQNEENISQYSMKTSTASSALLWWYWFFWLS